MAASMRSLEKETRALFFGASTRGIRRDHYYQLQGVIVSTKYSRLYATGAALATVIAMSMTGHSFAADIAVKAKPKPVETPFFIVNDTSVSFTYYPSWTDPGVSGGSDTVAGGIAGEKNTFSNYQLSIDHFDVWQYGTNLIHGELDLYGNQDPTNGIPGATGSREFFGFWTGTLGGNELSHSQAFSNFFTKDVSLMLNLTGNTQNNFLAPELAQVAPGVQLTLNLPGVVAVGIAPMKEWNHNSFDACGPTTFGVAFAAPCIGGGQFSGNRDFEWTWKIFTYVSEPLTFLPSADAFPLTFVNILNVTGPKGTGISNANCLALGCFGAAGAFNNNETKTEVFEDARLTLDTSKVLWGKPGIWDTYVGYRYWLNKFGTNHNAALFAMIAPETSVESTVYVGMTYHFK